LKSFIASLAKRESADVLLIPLWEGESLRILEKTLGSESDLRALDATNDFKGKLGEIFFLYREKALEPRVLLLGLGKEEKASAESLRRSYAQAARAIQAKQGKTANVALPQTKNLSHEVLLTACAEGLFLTNYAFTRFKANSLKDHSSILLEKIVFLDAKPSDGTWLKKMEAIAFGVHFVRDLVNNNADDKTAPVLARLAKEFEKKHPQIQTTILDKKRLEQEKLGLLLAVNRGSSHEPCLILSSYQGSPGSKEHVVLVGKGMSYDTGGLNLKTGDGMLTMKCDMAGAATVLGAVQTAAALGLKVNVTAVAPVAENCIDAHSYKPGDVYRSYSGKTVEITNTDAEGRLILADAMSYAVKNLDPSCLIDVASLTGAIVIALGEEVAGLFSADTSLSQELMKASATTGELLWEMPVHEDYRDSMKSEIADLINSGSRDGSSIKAALFLQEFVGDVPWAHIDFAGTCYQSKPKYYHTTKATGFGVRLLVEFLEQKASQKS
jgi:leucyl aminopeptidase